MSRSPNADRLNYRSGNDPLSDVVLRKICKLPVQQRFHLEQRFEGRPSLLAFEKLGTVDYWWIICPYNGLQHHLDLRTAMDMKLPDPSAIKTILDRARTQRQSIDIIEGRNEVLNAGDRSLRRRRRLVT